MISLVATILLFAIFHKHIERLNYDFYTTLQFFVGVWVILNVIRFVIVYYGRVELL